MEMDFNKNQSSKPLVVDLDGTLVKTNMLFECANNLMIRNPLRFIFLPGWLKKGKCHLNAQLADAYPVDVTRLPYNSRVLSLLEKQKASGRKIVLATACHRTTAESVASHLGLFDDVMASEEKINLVSETKRDLLVERFGEQGFDYIGNSSDDLPVWKSANKAYVVSSSPALIEKVRRIGNLDEVISNERISLAKALFKSLRPHQWVKNFLLFIPPLAAHQFGFTTVIGSIIAFVIFCLAASSVYILNDLIDVADDRHHHRKRHRPFAAGDLSLLLGWLLWPMLLIITCVIAVMTLPDFFCIVLAGYFVLTMAYSLRLKQIALLDVITLAILYTLRIIAGAAAINAPLSFWMLAFSMFLFLSLAFIKRFSELKSAREAGRTMQVKGRGYVHQDLEIISNMGIGAGYLSVLVLALYVKDVHTMELYHSPHFIFLACPILLYWISRAWLIADRGIMQDDPITFAIKDRISWVVGACFLGVFCLAMIVR